MCRTSKLPAHLLNLRDRSGHSKAIHALTGIWDAARGIYADKFTALGFNAPRITTSRGANRSRSEVESESFAPRRGSATPDAFIVSR